LEEKLVRYLLLGAPSVFVIGENYRRIVMKWKLFCRVVRLSARFYTLTWCPISNAVISPGK